MKLRRNTIRAEAGSQSGAGFARQAGGVQPGGAARGFTGAGRGRRGDEAARGAGELFPVEDARGEAE